MFDENLQHLVPGRDVVIGQTELLEVRIPSHKIRHRVLDLVEEIGQLLTTGSFGLQHVLDERVVRTGLIGDPDRKTGRGTIRVVIDLDVGHPSENSP